MRYVVVLTAEIEDEVQLSEVIRGIREAEIPHLAGVIHLAIHDVADRILEEFKA